MLLEDKNNLESLIQTKEALVASEEFSTLPDETQGFIILELIGLRARASQAVVELGKISE